MSGIAWLVVALLAPLVVWLVCLAVWQVRLRLARRRGEAGARAALERRLRAAAGRSREVVAVHTDLVDLPLAEVDAVAAERGYRLLGFERARGPLRTRLGVFVRSGGAVDEVLAGA